MQRFLRRLVAGALAILLGLGVAALNPTRANSQPASSQTPPANSRTDLPHGTQTLNELAAGRPSTAAATAGWAQGIDVAAYQHPNGAAVDWTQVAAAGYAFAFVKATQGNYYVNPYFQADYRDSQNAGLFRAAYHFADPSVSDGASQADYMLNVNVYTADNRTFPPAVDMENVSFRPFCYGLSAPAMVSWIGSFSSEVQRRIGRPATIYTRASWWNQCTGSTSAFGGSPLWVANYGAATPALPSGWNSWAFWQYTSGGAVPGIVGSVDVSYFNSSGGQLASFAAHSYVTVSTANGRLADLTGNGIKDILNFQQSSDAAVFVSLSNGSTLGAPTRWNPWGPFCFAGGTALVGDFNGDGLDDIACATQGSYGAVFVALSTGSAFSFPTRWNSWGPFCWSGSTPIVGRFSGSVRNGHPVDDIACLEQGGDGTVWVAPSTGSAFTLPTVWNAWGSFCYSGATPVAGDFNGDGRDDLACDQQSTDGAVMVATSTGSAFSPPSLWNSWGPFCYTGNTPLAGDFNGDGRDDIACDAQSTDGAVFVVTSTRSSFGIAVRWNNWGPFCWSGMTARATNLTAGQSGDGLACFTQGVGGDVWFTGSTGSSLALPSKWNPWGVFSATGHTPV